MLLPKRKPQLAMLRPDHEASTSIPRRQLLRRTALLGGAAITAPAASPSVAQNSNLPPNVPEWMQKLGEPLVRHPYGLPSEFEENVVRRTRGNLAFPGAGSALTPLQDLRGAMQVSTDGGRNWREAQLEEPVLSRAAVRFKLPWRWDGGEAILQSRAVDETGYVQPTLRQTAAVRGVASFYHNNSIQSWKVSQSGEIANVHA